MYMVDLHVDLEHLDIGIEVRQVLDELLGVFLDSAYEDLSPISRGPDDVVFGLVYRMTALPESHPFSVSD